MTKEIYTTDNQKTYDIPANETLVIHHYSIDSDAHIIINLLGNNAQVEYHYSTINYGNHTFKITVNHLSANTSSSIYNHGINVLNNQLIFDVCGVIPKTSSKVVCNQENQIINLQEGFSEICPKLLIDNYDTVSNHAAYIGKFKPEVLFYLESRGLTAKSAIRMLTTSLLLNGGNHEEPIVEKFLNKVGEI